MYKYSRDRILRICNYFCNNGRRLSTRNFSQVKTLIFSLIFTVLNHFYMNGYFFFNDFINRNYFFFLHNLKLYCKIIDNSFLLIDFNVCNVYRYIYLNIIVSIVTISISTAFLAKQLSCLHLLSAHLI